jgi:hypothetical protein
MITRPITKIQNSSDEFPRNLMRLRRCFEPRAYCAPHCGLAPFSNAERLPAIAGARGGDELVAHYRDSMNGMFLWVNGRKYLAQPIVVEALVSAAFARRWITPESSVRPDREITWKNRSAPVISTSMKLWS